MIKLFNWIGRALSENGSPSSKRLFGFLMVLTVCYCVIYTVHMLHKIPAYLYNPMLIVICLLASVATAAQVISLVRGNPNPPAKTDEQ